MAHAPINLDTQVRVAEHLGFEFDPSTCETRDHNGNTFYASACLSETGGRRYAGLLREPYARYYDPLKADGIMTEAMLTNAYGLLRARDDFLFETDEPVAPDPDELKDMSLHGLIEAREGHLILHDDFTRPEIFYFETTNGPAGANRVHELLGRTPGVDIPKFMPSNYNNGFFTAGFTTEAMADMAMGAPTLDNLWLARHDLGPGLGNHGTSWPHTAPAIYRQLSRVAQDIVQEHGEQIHDDATRPPETVRLIKTLDEQAQVLNPTITQMSEMELRIRDGRHESVSDRDIAIEALDGIYKAARRRQHVAAAKLMVATADDSESQRNRVGYWIDLQQREGVVATRIALHEVVPHPEASEAQTRRTLSVLHSIRTELNRRLEDNSAYTLPI